MASASRTFTDSPAVRRQVPTFVGLVSPSGGGKTFSALRLAMGMQRVVGGDIFGIDTEADRMLHYAEGFGFRFRHVPFEAPFNPLSYLAAFEHCARRGAKTIICDSASHMHEGPGGTLESHAAELDRLAGHDFDKRKRVAMLAWQKPKAELRRFLNTLLQMRVNVIFCFRAKEKLKLETGREPTPLGFMPIAGDEMFFEMTLSALLYPNSGGIPTWQPEEMGEKAIVKLPSQFKALFAQRRPLDEATGEALATWAAGGAAPPAGGAQSAPPAAGATTAAPKIPPADQAILEQLEQQLVANGVREKQERWKWVKAHIGRGVTPEAPLTEDEARRCLDRAEHEAAA